MLCCIQGLLSVGIIETIECNNSSGAVALHRVYGAPAHMYKLVQKHFRKPLQRKKSLVMHNLLLAAYSPAMAPAFYRFGFFFSPYIQHQRQKNCSGRSHAVCSAFAGDFSDNNIESPCYKHPCYQAVLNSVKKPQTHSLGSTFPVHSASLFPFAVRSPDHSYIQNVN